jgi:hypothetical protein
MKENLSKKQVEKRSPRFPKYPQIFKGQRERRRRELETSDRSTLQNRLASYIANNSNNNNKINYDGGNN